MDWLKEHVLAFGIVSVMPIAMWGAKKFLPTLAKKYADIFLKALVNPEISDPYVKEQVIVITKAAMRIAEHTMQGEAGHKRMTWVVDYVCSKTSLKRSDIEAITQGIFDSIEAELTEHGKEVSSNIALKPVEPDNTITKLKQ